MRRKKPVNLKENEETTGNNVVYIYQDFCKPFMTMKAVFSQSVVSFICFLSHIENIFILLQFLSFIGDFSTKKCVGKSQNCLIERTGSIFLTLNGYG